MPSLLDLCKDRKGVVSLVTDDSIESPLIQVTESSSCVYEAVLSVPASACADRRYRSPILFSQIKDLEIKLSEQENTFHVAGVPHGADVKIVGQDEDKTTVLLGRKNPSLFMKGVTQKSPERR